MKQLININHSNTTDIALLIARVSLGILMLTHGLPKMSMLLSGEPVLFPAVLGLSSEMSLSLTVFAEVFCSLLLIAGLATRMAVIPLIITMLVAIYAVHGADPFANKEIAVLYLAGYLVLFFSGSGKYSFDFLLAKSMKLKKVYA